MQVLKPLLLLFVFSAATTTAYAQTAEQMRIINQLPASQREQALNALRQLQSSSSSSSISTQSSITEPLTGEDAQLEPTDMTQAVEPVELVVDAGSRVVINLTPKESLTTTETAELNQDPVLSRLQGSQFFELDNSGVLHLPGLKDIALMGLNDEAIVQRLSAEPALSVFDISAVLLDSQPIGVDALKPYGYEILTPDTASLDPVAAGPVPPDYVLGPGDSIRVQLFGNVNGIYEFEVSRDGVLNLPELGPITVAGLPFSEFRSDLNKRVQEMLIGTQVSVTMGQLRTIRVFVLGDANRPGSYVVSSLATISNALYRSGGISEIGTLRNIQLKRQGKLAARLDLYDLLLQGDTSGDERLQPGDVIFIPPIGETIAVAGAVRRPAIYELRGKASVADAIQLAGGLLPDAYPAGARLERIDAESKRIVMSVDAAGTAGGATMLSGGDTLTIPQVLPELNNSVLLAGHVQRPGAYQWWAGMRLTDLITALRELAPGADANYLLIRREDTLDRRVSVASANLQRALANPESTENPPLRERDTVHVFSLALGRQRVIAPIMEELNLQARFGEPFNAVHVEGHVRASGVYPLEAGMRISDLIRAGGSMAEGAYALDAELTRYAIVNGEYRTKDIVDVALAEILNGNEQADLVLSPHDHLKISLVPDWQSDWSVTLDGELKFPGVYQIRRGETLLDVIGRAGGLTENAFPEGAIFLRESLKEREREQIEVLIRRMETDLAAMSLETLDTTGTEALTTGQTLLDQLRNTEPVGRLVIDVSTAGGPRSRSELASDLELKDGDRLLVPTRSQEVTVLGEAQYTTSHLYQAGLARDDYIALSGGLTRKADKKQIYVVRASGAVVTSGRSRWFGRGGNLDIRPGDTIVIPLETDRIRPLTFWTNVTQILYQGAIAVAAVNSFNN